MDTIYTDFAPIYDCLLQHVDYDRWYRYIKSLMLRYIKNPRLILELGCGTGKFGAKFSRDGFAVFGMDISISMLRIAKLRAYGNFRIFCADMRNFQLARKFDFIFSVHDTMNYFLEYSDLRSVLRSTKGGMHEESVFMFDMTTEHNIMRYFDKKLMRYTIRDIQVEWSNSYDPEEKVVFSTLRFTKPDGSTTVEKHVQRIYTVDEMSGLLQREGFAIIDIFSDYSFSAVKEDAVMINFVTRKE